MVMVADITIMVFLTFEESTNVGAGVKDTDIGRSFQMYVRINKQINVIIGVFWVYFVLQ